MTPVFRRCLIRPVSTRRPVRASGSGAGRQPRTRIERHQQIISPQLVGRSDEFHQGSAHATRGLKKRSIRKAIPFDRVLFHCGIVARKRYPREGRFEESDRSTGRLASGMGWVTSSRHERGVDRIDSDPYSMPRTTFPTISPQRGRERRSWDLGQENRSRIERPRGPILEVNNYTIPDLRPPVPSLARIPGGLSSCE